MNRIIFLQRMGPFSRNSPNCFVRGNYFCDNSLVGDQFSDVNAIPAPICFMHPHLICMFYLAARVCPSKFQSRSVQPYKKAFIKIYIFMKIRPTVIEILTFNKLSSKFYFPEACKRQTAAKTGKPFR